MKKTSVLAALAVLTCVGAVWCATTVWDSSNFTMDERKWQPCPTGHEVGKDNAAGGPGHHATDDCGICHAPADRGGIAREFTLTATIYDNRMARQPAEGVEVIFQDYEGQTFSMLSNDLGMMWTDCDMAGDATMGDPTDSNNWRYKAWVRMGDEVRPMMTMTTVGGMMVPRMSCNMHHVISGTLGGLWVNPEATLHSYPATDLSYNKHIFPILRSKCAPCHKPGKTEADRAGEVFDYGADLDLVTYAGSDVELEGVAYSKRGVLEVINTATPAASMLLAKTVEGAVHGGGTFWAPGDPDYEALRQWIAEGARDN